MKLTEVKHKHLLTDILKVLLFSIIMLVPILSVATRCLYVICNKNAYQSYYGETINEKENKYIHNLTNFEVNETYYFNSKSYNPTKITGVDFGGSSNRITFTNINVIHNSTNYDLPSIIQLGFWKDTSTNFFYMYGYDEENNIIFTGVDSRNNEILFTFDYLSNNLNSTVVENTDLFYQIEYNTYSYLDNVFEYSVNKLNNNPLINWTQQTAIYTGVNTMTTQLGITNAVIPMLIVYWFLMTVIYIIIDIIIKLFTYLTHMIGNKTT